MTNVQKAVFGDSTTTLLPHPTDFTFALFVEMTGAGDAVVLVALELVETVAGALVGDDVL
jgi:hypothetical protein